MIRLQNSTVAHIKGNIPATKTKKLVFFSNSDGFTPVAVVAAVAASANVIVVVNIVDVAAISVDASSTTDDKGIICKADANAGVRDSSRRGDDMILPLLDVTGDGR